MKRVRYKMPRLLIMCLLILCLTYSNSRAQITKKDSLSLDEKAQLLQEVLIEKKTEKRLILETPLPVELLDLKPILGQSGNLENTLRRVPGVHIRSDGGIGDPINITLNGLDKKAIVLFKDGIPMSFYGHSFEPGNISTNMFDRIEIYKGVLPLSLAADALGGGINFITKKHNRKALDVSFETASFNTQRMGLNFYIPDTLRGWYVGGNINYTLSDNNWKIDVGKDIPEGVDQSEIPNAFNGYIFDGSEKVRQKNNGVNAYTGEYYVGIKNKTWTDDLRLTMVNSWYYRRMNRLPSFMPMGTAAWSVFSFAEDKTISSLLSYKKKLFDERLKLDLVGGYSYTNAVFVDTSSYSVNRFGVIVGRNVGGKGEISPNGADMNLDYKFYTVRFNAAYDVLSRHQLQFNYFFTNSNRTGRDTLGGMVHSVRPENFGQRVDLYQYPALHEKHISALGFRSLFFDGKLENLLAGKYYRRSANGYSTYGRPGSEKTVSENSSHWGWVEGISFHPNDRWLIKASYEFATRLPDDFEVFGDSRSVKSSFGLKPERSRNANLQLQYNSTHTGIGKWLVGSNFFYRKTSDLILLMPDIPFSYHENAVFGIEVKGVELDLYYQPFSFFSLGGNATYMDRQFYIDKGPAAERGKGRAWEKPPILANLQARLLQADWFQKGSRIELYWYWTYTHRYAAFPFVGTDLGLFDKMDKENTTLDLWIPPYSGKLGQAVHTVGLIYHFSKPLASIAIESYNVTDRVLYDNFLTERPGRSLSVKLRWQLD